MKPTVFRYWRTIALKNLEYAYTTNYKRVERQHLDLLKSAALEPHRGARHPSLTEWAQVTNSFEFRLPATWTGLTGSTFLTDEYWGIIKVLVLSAKSPIVCDGAMRRGR
jgi:hypothetical protein